MHERQWSRVLAYWSMGDRGFIGFRFTDANGQVDYGYIELETDAFVNAGNPGGVQIFQPGL